MGKELQNRTGLLRDKMRSASVDINASAQVQAQTMEEYISKTAKERVFVDESLIDDAPPKWNSAFPPLSPEKMLELKMSIMGVGILSPVILWEKGDGRYVNLAGHNRVHAVREILAEYKGVQHRFDYSKVPAIIYGKDEIDENRAYQIVLDTNVIQRGEMPPKIRVAVMKARIPLLQAQTDEKGATIDQLAQEYNLTKTSVYEDIQIGTKIISPLQELYFDGKINRRAVLKFPRFSEELQWWIYNSFGSKLTSDRICQLNKRVKTREQIEQVFTDQADDEPRVHTQITVPKSKLSKFRDFCTFYLGDEEFAEMCDSFIAERLGAKED